MRRDTQHLWRKVRDARPLFHRTEKDLMVKGNAIFSVFLNSPHRLRISVPIDGETRLISFTSTVKLKIAWLNY